MSGFGDDILLTAAAKFDELRAKIKKLEDENKALRKFILSMANQIGIIVKKL